MFPGLDISIDQLVEQDSPRKATKYVLGLHLHHLTLNSIHINSRKPTIISNLLRVVERSTSKRAHLLRCTRVRRLLVRYRRLYSMRHPLVKYVTIPMVGLGFQASISALHA